MTTTADSELPSYAAIGGDITLPATSANPPDVPPSPWRSEYKTGLQDETGYAWLVLRVQSRSPNTKNMPFFIEGDTISGVVEIDAAKTSSVKAVFVEAGTTAVGQEEERFLSLKETLWPPADSAKASKNLKGHNEWPFDFVLPKEVEVVGPHSRRGFYPLPSSFSERASPAYLDYRIVVTVRRGAFRVSQKLSATFFFQPVTFPEAAPSSLMQLAFVERNQLPSPKQDPDGWKVLKRLEINGTLFDAKKVEVGVQLSLARPLQYAIGSAVPLHLIIESEDARALDVLSNTVAPRINLMRAMTTGSEATAEHPERRSDNFFSVPVAGAYLWTVDEPGSGQNRKILHGEIDLEMKLKPTFVFPRLSVEYTIDFAGFEAAGWSSGSQRREEPSLLSEPIKLTSRQLAGVQIRSNAPPGYQKPAIDFNKSLGYLENGNQRFLHHGGW